MERFFRSLTAARVNRRHLKPEVMALLTCSIISTILIFWSIGIIGWEIYRRMNMNAEHSDEPQYVSGIRSV
jgi:hypothetical protein